MSDVFQYACRLLARREYSIGELRNRLETKFPGRQEVESVMERLVTENLVCDQRFAQALVRSRVARLQGPRKIRAELSRRLVDPGHAEAALEREGGAWTELAKSWLARQGSATRDFDERAKYYRRLLSRGFTHDQAMDALSDPGTSDEGV